MLNPHVSEVPGESQEGILDYRAEFDGPIYWRTSQPQRAHGMA